MSCSPITSLSEDQLRSLEAQLSEEFLAYKAKGLSLNMARGKPSNEQLNLSLPLLDAINSSSSLFAEDGTDCRNYGVLDGLPEAKRLMAAMVDESPENVFVMGASSLNAMYDTIARCLDFGTVDSDVPWCQLENVSWICPVPGYDRHFSICEAFGITMIPVPMNSDGPDMDEVERIAASSDNVKGIWCVPKYSNPGGITYSDTVVRRLASMKAAPDFRIFWDNAYCVHHLYDSPSDQDTLLDIGVACREAGNPDRYFKFASTSKVTLPGAGISAFACSKRNMDETKRRMTVQTIGFDKINQLRHVAFLKDAEGIAEHMKKHAALLRPKFQLVLEKLDEALSGSGIATWQKPRGGYFVSFDAMEGTAKQVVAMAKEAGVTMTNAGATWPYGKDPHDSNIRIAPTLPPLEELSVALDVFVCCVKLAAVRKLLGE